ncbi:MAG: DMT family transporter [Clostridia bacterium]|nr:DMT family transporter [Clostridia bacterium]
MNLKKAFGSFALLFAAVIWGFAFVAQTSGADNIPTFTFNFLRSYIAVIFLALLSFVIAKAKPADKKCAKASLKSLALGGIICGTALFAATSFQQYGISIYPEGANASSRAAFITAIYVLLVPVFSAMIFKKRINVSVWCGVVIAIFGMYLLCFGRGIGALYTGDAMVFISALCFCLHILVVDHFVKSNDGILLSCVQFFVMGTLSLVCMLIFETPSFDAILNSLLPILYLGIMSSGVAYTLQIIGQKHTEPAIASIIMSLESVFGAVGGWLILGDLLSAKEFIGCALVFSAILIAQSSEFRKKS